MSKKQIPLILLIALLTLLAAQCGSQPPAVQEETPPPTEEAAAAEEEATPEDDQQVIKEVVEESSSVKAQEKKDIVVVSDEDVSASRAHSGGEYHDVATSDAVSFHLYQTTDTASHAYSYMVYDSNHLLRLDEETLEYIPHAAEKYTISEDGLTFTFHLRQDMKWSDGEPITAHDYKWTYDQAIKPENGFAYVSQLDFIESYEALDDYTLQVTIEEVYAPALGQIDLIMPYPKHIWEDLDWNDPETNPEINHPSVVSGPYKLVEWKRDQYVIFEANENYWYHGPPNIERYIIEIVPDQDVAYQKMKTGESDTAPIQPEQLDEARALEHINVYEWWPAAARWSYIGLNMREGFPTHDINIRHGLNYAIDKELLTDEVMLGQAKRLCSVFPETSWVYAPDAPCYPYDTDKALEAFAKSGYTLQDDKLVDENGEQLRLKLSYGPNTSKIRELIAVTVQDYLGDVGIEVEIQALEWASFLETIHSEDPDWDMFIGGWSATIEPHIMYTIWAEESIPQLNSVAYVNEEVEALFKEAGRTYDTEFRRERYQEIQRLISEDAPYVFLFYNKSWSGQNKRIKGIEPTPLGIGWNMEDWYIEE